MVSVFGGTILFVKVLTDYWLKRKLIEKGHVTPEETSILYNHFSESKYSGIKWGLIILFGGIGLIVINMLPQQYDYESSLPYGVFCVSVALGFLVYYMMMKKEEEKKSE